MQSIRQLSGVSLPFGGAVVSDWGTVTLDPHFYLAHMLALVRHV